jgi:hypothetical protein
VLVWVMDPQKYADAAVHDRYLAPHAGHAGVLLVVLNQVDRLEPETARTVAADLRRLLDSEGLAATPVLPVSARTGDGLPSLRQALAGRVVQRRAASDRLTADVRAAGAALQVHCGDGGSELAKSERTGLTRALSDAAGVPAVVSAVERSARRTGIGHTGWPPLRWTARLRPDPLGRLHVGNADSRTSLPPASPAQRAAVTTTLRRARDSAGAGLPQAWRDDLRRTVEAREDRLADHLDRAVAGAGPGTARTPFWQTAVSGLQWLLVLTALVGALWLLALVGLAYLQLDDVVPLPRVEGFPLPTLLLGVGLLGGLLLALLAGPFVRASARRRGRRTERRLHAAVEEVAREQVLAPLELEVAAHARFRSAVERAAA